jgi:hypothetical protein
MINLRNLASRRSNISANSNSKEKFQNQVKHQDPDTMTISAITPNGCTTSTLMVVGCQRIGRRATKGLHRKETQTLLTKDPPRTISRAEIQTVARGAAEAHTHPDLYSACNMETKPTIAPKIAPSTSRPNGKWTKCPPNLRHNYNTLHPTLRIIQLKHTKIAKPNLWCITSHTTMPLPTILNLRQLHK